MATLSKPIAKKAALTVKPENITCYVIEANDHFNMSNLTQEEVVALQQHNDTFENETLYPELLMRATPCTCQHQRIMERVQTRMKLMGKDMPNGGTTVELEQEDIDTREFGVVVNSQDGKNVGVSMIVSRCKGCSAINMWGTIETVTSMVANACNDFANRQKMYQQMQEAAIAEAMAARDETVTDAEESEVANGPAPMFMTENLETGERQPADDLASALFGDGSDAYQTTPVDESES